MKKLIAALLTLCLMAAACSAFADTRMMIADTGMSLTVPDDLMEAELTEDEIDEGALALYVDEEETLSMYIGGYTDLLSIEELKDYLESEDEFTYLDFTTINGITAVCEVCPEENGDGFFVIYWFSVEDGVVFIEFWCQDEEAAERTRVIMETLA